MRQRPFFCVLGILLLSLPGWAQKKNEQYQYLIQRASSSIQIDGRAADAAWQAAAVASDFFMVLPMDTSRTQVRTEVRMLYDDHNLYLLAVCYEGTDGPYMVESLRRDFSFGRNDNFIVFLDPFDDQTNGFAFGSNAEGAQWDGLIFEGGSVNLSWDNKWTSAVHTEEDKWVFEMAVPFKTLRYKDGIDRWGINFSRLDLKTTEKSAWAPVPRQFPTASLAYTGVLVWEQPPPRAGTNISVIPYALGYTAKDFTTAQADQFRANAGVDAKIGVTSSLNLDLTVNPDFSQVEVDQQQTNLDRFELYFPERRQFFLENGDLFTNFGYGSIRPFFSRRIGLNTNIDYGARLSGKLNKNWRIGFMDMQTAAKEAEGLPRQNFAIAALQRQLFRRSNITALLVNKESLAETSGNRYNRNLGFEYNLLSSNNFWTGKAMYLKSFSPGVQTDNQVMAANLSYNDRKWSAGLQYENVGRNYRAEVGFVPRTGYQFVNSFVGRIFFPKSSPLLSHGPQLRNFYYLSPEGRPTEFTNVFIYQFQFLNRAELRMWTARDYVRLLDPFDPTNFSGYKLDKGTVHRWVSTGGEFISRPQRLLTYSVNWRYGGYYADGRRLRLGGSVGYRIQPKASFALTMDYNHITFEEAPELPFQLQNSQWNLWLIGPRIDLTLSNKLFFTNFVQLNSQTRNVNLNLRMQWRYSPASDFFIVFTDNYLTDSFQLRNRALIAKWTFWWNV